MRQLHYILLVSMVWITVSQARSDKPVQPNRIIKNWATAQTGEFAGHFGSMGALLLLDGVNGSSEVSSKVVIFSSIIAGNLTANYWLKQETNQTWDVFIHNVLFSAAPTVIYALAVRPEFDAHQNTFSNVRHQAGLLLVSLLVTSVFSTLGNEILNSPKQRRPARASQYLQPYLLTGRQYAQIGIRVQF